MFNHSYSPTTFDHWAGGLHSGYCLGNNFLFQFVRNITLYSTRRFELHSDDVTEGRCLNTLKIKSPVITLNINRVIIFPNRFMIFGCLILFKNENTVLSLNKVSNNTYIMLWLSDQNVSSNTCDRFVCFINIILGN